MDGLVVEKKMREAARARREDGVRRVLRLREPRERNTQLCDGDNKEERRKGEDWISRSKVLGMIFLEFF